MFNNLPARDELSSRVVGLDLYNNANQNIGTIKAAKELKYPTNSGSISYD
jgi:hypothetical protein